MVSKTNVASCLAVLLAIGTGCEQGTEQANVPPPNQPAVVAPPTTLPAPETPTAIRPNAVEPVASYLWLREVSDPKKSAAEAGEVAASEDPNGVARQFPRARLRLTGKGEDRIVAMLYSDDPKEAISKTWQGDRYYFRMPLQVSEASHLDQAPFRMAVPFEGSDETSTGVFLQGDRYHLEPIDLMVRFEPEGGQVKVFLGGLFKQYDTSDITAEPRWFHVQGIIQATVD